MCKAIIKFEYRRFKLNKIDQKNVIMFLVLITFFMFYLLVFKLKSRGLFIILFKKDDVPLNFDYKQNSYANSLNRINIINFSYQKQDKEPFYFQL